MIADLLDLDSDNDGIPDAIEAQPTAGFMTPSIGMDLDGDGVVNTFDSTTGFGGDFSTPEDTDGDGVADFLDDDSDNDGISDTDESGLMLTNMDGNDDGIDDGVGADFTDTDGPLNNPIDNLTNDDGDASDVDFRSVEPITATVTIAGPGSVVEGQTTTAYTVSLDETVPTGNSVEVALTYTGVATDGTDFTGVTTVTIPAGANNTTFTIATIDDPIAEGAESFVVTITGITDTDGSFDMVAIGTANNVTTTINDEATPGPEDTATVSISGPSTVIEGETATYTVAVDSAPVTNLDLSLIHI